VRANPIDRAPQAHGVCGAVIYAYLNRHPFSLETSMNAEISAKFAAFTAALTINGLIIAAVAYIFNVPLSQRVAAIADSGERPPCECSEGRVGYCPCEATTELRRSYE
jgi:hypothetical protein